MIDLGPLFFLVPYAPFFFLRHGPDILHRFFGWWAWLAGIIVGLEFFITAIYPLIHSYREACDPARDTETSCEIGGLIVPAMVGWYLLVFALFLPHIVRTLKTKPQNRVA